MDAPDARYATTTDGLRIAYQVVGDGDLPVVFIPTIHSIDVMWDEPSYARTLQRLAGLGRLIVLDFRGWGSSDPVPLGALPTAEAWMEDIRAVMDDVGVGEAAVVVESGSTFLALMFAATYPERTLALVVLNGYARLYRSDDYPMGFDRQTVTAFIDALGRSWGAGTATALAFAPSRARDERFLRWHHRYERSAASPSSWQAMVRWAFEFDLRDILPTISAPTLVLHRRNSATIPVELGRYIAEHIPLADFRNVDGQDHYLFSEGADELLDAIEEFVTGAPPVRDVDRVLATVLFTDIVDSTPTATRLGDAKWRAVLDQHDAVVKREIERYRGREIKTTGDGVLATFDGPARAARCASGIGDALRPLGIGVRAGLHTGEVELRGEDIGGIAVHIAQRVSGLAGAGEVLVSRTVTDLVAGSGLEFEERGEHELKGVPGKWAIFAVRS